LILNARHRIDLWLSALLKVSADETISVVERLIAILNDDCSFIYIPAVRRSDAYRLFQVLNDRGQTLSAGDLLRSATLELLEEQKFIKLQPEVERLWNDILCDQPKRTEDFLQWYFSAHQGNRPHVGSLFDDFMNAFFLAGGKGPQSLKDANNMVARIRDLR